MAILQVNDIYMGFSGETLFKDINFSVDEKDKIGIIGVNGAGKTTLIKLLLGLENSEINPATNERGTISKKSNLKIGYLAQNTQLNKENTVFNELMTVFNNLLEDYNRMQEINFLLTVDLDNFDKLMEELGEVSERYERHEGYSIEYKIKQILNGLNIPENLWTMKIGNLSGGQNSRVALAKILLEEPDLLILDEPTNHLDIYSREILMDALEDYPGTILVVSHDRNFLDTVVTKIYELKTDGVETFDGDYEAYKQERDNIKIKNEEAVKSYEEQKKAKNRLASLEKKLIRIEEELQKVQEQIEEVNKKYLLAGEKNNVDELMSLQEELDNLNLKMIEKFQEWEETEIELKDIKG